MNFKCFFGHHDWRYTVTINSLDVGVTLPPNSHKRKCVVCGKKQQKEVHCLGLNPPEYIEHWRNIK